MNTVALLDELKGVMAALDEVYVRRDANIRETNDLMIAEHNLRAQLQRINVDLIRGE